MLSLRGCTVTGDGGGQAQCQGAARLEWGSWGAGSLHSFELGTMVPPRGLSICLAPGMRGG